MHEDSPLTALKVSWLGWGYPPFDETADARTRKILDERFEALSELTPDSGAYMSEVGYRRMREQAKTVLTYRIGFSV